MGQESPTHTPGEPKPRDRLEYELLLRPLVQRISISAELLNPSAGALVSARGLKLRLDTGEVVAPERIECLLRLAGKRIPPLSGGCCWRIPKSARGNSGTLELTVAYGGCEYRDSYAVKVGD